MIALRVIYVDANLGKLNSAYPIHIQAASTEAGQGTGKVLAVMTAQLLDHIRRGKGDVLFASILTAAQTTLDALDSTSGITGIFKGHLLCLHWSSPRGLSQIPRF